MRLLITEIRIIPRIIPVDHLDDLAEFLKEGMLVSDYKRAVNIGRPYGVGGIGGIEFRVPYHQEDSKTLDKVRALAEGRGLRMDLIIQELYDGAEIKFYDLKRQ